MERICNVEIKRLLYSFFKESKINHLFFIEFYKTQDQNFVILNLSFERILIFFIIFILTLFPLASLIK